MKQEHKVVVSLSMRVAVSMHLKSEHQTDHEVWMNQTRTDNQHSVGPLGPNART